MKFYPQFHSQKERVNMTQFNEIQIGDKIRIDHKELIEEGHDLTNGVAYNVVGKQLETPESYATITIVDDSYADLRILESELHAVTKVA